MRKVRTKSLPDGQVKLEIPVYRRLQALVVESNRSESELLTMAVRLLCTAVSRTPNFNEPKRTATPKTKQQRSKLTHVGQIASRIVDNTKRKPPR